jgi:signal transduction histidine kinase
MRTRLRLALYVGMVSLAGGLLFDALVTRQELQARALIYGKLGVLYLVTLGCSYWPPAARRPRALTVVYLLALGAHVFPLLALAAADLDVFTGVVGALMVGSTLIFPWGAAVQSVVSIGLAWGFTSVLAAHGFLAGPRATTIVLTLAVSALMSIFGAEMLERSRRSAFVERRRVHALAVQRRHLIDVGRDLRSTLHADALATRLLAHAARIIPCDSVLLALFDAATGGYRVAAVTGPPFESVTDVAWSASFSEQFRHAFAPAEVHESPGSPIDPVVAPLLATFGLQRLLAAAIGPHPMPAGFITWNRTAAEPFTLGQRLAAQGIADQAFTALSAARLYEEAARASQLKSEFVSTMSHELRTPLNVIMGYTQILRETLAADPETVRTLDGVQHASIELLDLVEATLDLGRLETGRESVVAETVDVRALFEELAGEFAPVPRAAGVALHWDATSAPGLTADRRKLRVVLKNLVSNALKFTPAGSIRVEARRVGDHCRFRVVDTGIGIRPADQAVVFEMFRQADSSDTRRYGGTGLGLYIVRRLVELLGGEVALESAPGCGSTFTVTVPLDGAAATTSSVAA